MPLEIKGIPGYANEGIVIHFGLGDIGLSHHLPSVQEEKPVFVISELPEPVKKLGALPSDTDMGFLLLAFEFDHVESLNHVLAALTTYRDRVFGPDSWVLLSRGF
jgi:hypothetical protein